MFKSPTRMYVHVVVFIQNKSKRKPMKTQLCTPCLLAFNLFWNIEIKLLIEPVFEERRQSWEEYFWRFLFSFTCSPISFH